MACWIVPLSFLSANRGERLPAVLIPQTILRLIPLAMAAGPIDA